MVVVVVVVSCGGGSGDVPRRSRLALSGDSEALRGVLAAFIGRPTALGAACGRF